MTFADIYIVIGVMVGIWAWFDLKWAAEVGDALNRDGTGTLKLVVVVLLLGMLWPIGIAILAQGDDR